MKYKIIGDSCCDFTEIDLEKEHVTSVPLTLLLGDKEFVDDSSFDQEVFLKEMEAYSECAKSACPSPQAYLDAFEGADEVYVITLSSKLSGSYNSAMTAKSMMLDENPNAKVHVFDSKSAASGQYLVYLKIEEAIKANKKYEEVIEQVEDFIANMTTVFVLEDLDNLRKNGRLSKMKALAASVLNIKPILISDDGEIQQLDQARGTKRALDKLVANINVKEGRKAEFFISHCACPERAEEVKNKLKAKFNTEDVSIRDTRGISTLYASRGGIIVVY